MSGKLLSSSRWLLRRKCSTNHLTLTLRSLHGPQWKNEFTDQPNYPKIPQFKSKEEKCIAKTKESVKQLGTVEEKMYQINRPKYYGWYSYMIRPDYVAADLLGFSQFATWTRVQNGLPDYFQQPKLEEESSKIISEIGGLIEQVILNEACYRQPSHLVSNDKLPLREKNVTGPGMRSPIFEENDSSRAVIKRIHEIIQSHLALSHQHLKDSVEDYDARNESFWFRGGVQPDQSMRRKRKGIMDKMKEKKLKGERIVEFAEGYLESPYERSLQIKHSSVVQVRHELPLDEFISRDDPLCTEIKVPIVDFDPRAFGLRAKCQHGTNIPGYWPEDSHQQGLLAYHTRVNGYNSKCVMNSSLHDEQVTREQDVSKGILTNFSWLLPQACHLGFSPLNELTYPLTSQSVNTDGRKWSFFAYQMNTCDLSHNDMSEHTHQNVLWTQPPVDLYSKVEDGKVVSYDPDCLKPLIKMYLNKPRERPYNMKPYLSSVDKLVDFKDDYQRDRFMTIIRNQLSNRPKTVEKPELYMWEKIMLIDNNAFPELDLARRRRWWHMAKIDFLGKEHWDPEFVNTDEKRDRYIPKGMRPENTRKGPTNRRNNKLEPKIVVPLKERIAVLQLPDTKYKDED